MNPDTNTLEHLMTAKELEEHSKQLEDKANRLWKAYSGVGEAQLYRPNGEPVPKHWSVFREGQHVVVENYTFKVAHIGEKHLLLEPVGPVVLGEGK